jgi:hypothetical protein
MQHSLDRHQMVSSTSTLTPVSPVSCLAHGVRGHGCFFPIVYRIIRCGASPRPLASAFRSLSSSFCAATQATRATDPLVSPLMQSRLRTIKSLGTLSASRPFCRGVSNNSRERSDLRDRIDRADDSSADLSVLTVVSRPRQSRRQPLSDTESTRRRRRENLSSLWSRASASTGRRSSACQCCPQSGVDLLRGLLLHARHHVAIGVQRDADGGVTEALEDDLGVHARLQERRDMRVAQVMEGGSRVLVNRYSLRRRASKTRRGA